MKFLLVLAGFVLSCSTAYGQWVEDSFTDDGLWSYIDTTSFHNEGSKTLFKVAYTTQCPCPKDFKGQEVSYSLWQTQTCSLAYLPYLDRWLERQKKAKEEKETKGNK